MAAVAVFPLTIVATAYTMVRRKTCARRKVWRDIMGANASAADPNIADEEHFLGQTIRHKIITVFPCP